MDDWIDRLAEALGEKPVTPAELRTVLGLARDVAHGVERKLAPVSTFLAGVHVGKQSGLGTSREEALARAVDRAEQLIPQP
jgi:Domain of unknown function (DUF6457)